MNSFDAVYKYFPLEKKCNVREYAGVINYISLLNLEEPGLC